MVRWAQFIIRLRWAVLSLCAVVALAAAFAIPRLQFDFSIVPLIEANDEVRREVEQFQADVPFRPYDQLVALTWPKRIRGSELEQLLDLQDRLEAEDEVESCFSILNAPLVRTDVDSPFPVTFKFRDRVGDGTALELAERHPLVMRRLISQDGRSVTLFVQSPVEGPAAAPRLYDFLRGEIPKIIGDGVDLRFVGDAASGEAMARHMKKDLSRGLLIQFVLFAILLPIVFRSIRGAVLPLACVVVADLFAAGLVVATGQSIGFIDLPIPGIIAMIGICDSVHLLHRFEEFLAEGETRAKALRSALRHVGPACFFTSITTAIGFLSLLVADHQAVREFGVKASCAVFMAFAAVMVVAPTLLAIWPIKHAALPRIPGLRRLSYGRFKTSLAAFALVVVFAVFGIQRLEIDSRWLEEMPENDPVVQDLEWFEDNFGGLLSIDIRLQGKLDTAEAVLGVARFQDSLRRLPGMRSGESYVDWIREVTGQPAALTPEEAQRGLGLLKLSRDWFPVHTVNPDFRTGRITFFTADDGTQKFFERRDAIQRLARDLPEGIEADVAGYMVMAHESSRLVVTTMLQSFLVSLLSISLLVTLIYRSWRVGLISVIPNVLPILVALGLNGWAGIPLRIGIVMIYSLGLGLAVDDSIHLFTRFSQERRRHPTEAPRSILIRGLRSSGAALITTSMILFLGAVTWLPSDFKSLRDTGILLSTIVTVAVLADLFFLPHLWERFCGKESMQRGKAAALENE